MSTSHASLKDFLFHFNFWENVFLLCNIVKVLSHLEGELKLCVSRTLNQITGL